MSNELSRRATRSPSHAVESSRRNHLTGEVIEMFCPRCGQQAAEEVRFCSRCGLALGAAAGLVEAGDSAAPVALTPRQRGTRKGLMITAGGVLFFVIVAVLNTFKDDFFPVLLLAGLIITAGVMRMLYALLLEEHAPARQSLGRSDADAAPALAREGRRAELPPARTVPANAFGRHGADTSDMAAPATVTESTTRLLDEEESRRSR